MEKMVCLFWQADHRCHRCLFFKLEQLLEVVGDGCHDHTLVGMPDASDIHASHP